MGPDLQAVRLAEVVPLAVVGVGQDVAMSIDGSASARAKLARAIEHDGELRDLYESAGLKMSITRDPDLEPTDDPAVFLSNWRITEMDPIPTRWSCVAGDAVHNLRSALDHLAWQLVLLDSDGDPYRYTSWPITTSQELFEERAASVLKDLDADHVAFVRERQPWFAEEFKALEWLRPLDDPTASVRFLVCVQLCVNSFFRRP